MTIQRVQAQCALDCVSRIQLSLDENCMAEVTPDMVLNSGGTHCPGGVFEVILKYNGQVIPTSPIVDSSWVGKTIEVTVRDTVTGNSCWGLILVEDKLPPRVECGNDTVYCYELYSWTGPALISECTDTTLRIIDEQIQRLQCDSVLIKRVIRKYVVSDAYGNTAMCQDTFSLQRIPLDSITPPPNWVKGVIIIPPDTIVMDSPAISCDDVVAGRIPLLPNGAPSWEYTGVPKIGDFPLYPPRDVYCNTTAYFNDIYVGKVGCVEKWLRIWTIQEWWCNTDFVRQIVQGIEIVDTIPPVITCPHDITVTTSGGSACEADVWLPMPDAYDVCQGDNITIDVSWPGGFVKDMQGPVLAKLPAGHHKVTYRVYDAKDLKGCYNMDSCTIDVWVKDLTPPVVICKKHTTVSMTYDSIVRVYADAFDNGTYDDCCLDSIVVKRMDNGGACTYQPDFKPYVEFCCADIGNTVMVILRAYDCHGNYNECMVEVEVQDKIPPVISCPSQLVFVPCGYPLDTARIDSQFGTVVKDKHAVKKRDLYGDYAFAIDIPPTVMQSLCDLFPDPLVVRFVVIDGQDTVGCSVVPIVPGPRHLTREVEIVYVVGSDFIFFNGDPIPIKRFVKDGFAFDNCDFDIDQTLEDHRDACGIGYVKRTFTASDNNGSSSCCQHIFFYPINPFGPDDILWPDNVNVEGCLDPDSLSPDITGKPEFRDNECSQVGYDYSQDIFRFFDATQTCFKIAREWRVIDWCYKAKTFDEYWSNDYLVKVWKRTQFIKVINKTAPEFVSLPNDNISICSYDTRCRNGLVEFTVVGRDDCTPGSELYWEMHLDYDCDGRYDILRSGNGDTIHFRDSVPLGWHCAVFTFEDRCGNVVTAKRKFHVVSCKAPTPFCRSGLVVELMPIDRDGDGTPDWGMLEVWASDFDDKSVGACGHPITFSFSSDTADKSRIYDCNTLDTQEVEMWITDLVTGEQAYCKTKLIVQDNMNVCPDSLVPSGGVMAGHVVNVEDAPLAGVEVILGGSAHMTVKTEADGKYEFPAMPFGGSYEVVPKRESGYLNGVTTRDLILIHRHLLGKMRFHSPYQYIAADVNMSDDVSVADLGILRKLILGKIRKFPNSPSWRFVRMDYNFPNPNEPWSFPDTYHLDPFNRDMTNLDFRGIKLGDVSGDPGANGKISGSSTRDRQNYILRVHDRWMDRGEELVDIVIYPQEPALWEGVQLQWTVDTRLAEPVDVHLGNEALQRDWLIDWNLSEEGRLTVVAYHRRAEQTKIETDAPVLVVRMKVKEDCRASEVLRLNPTAFASEVYVAGQDRPIVMHYIQSSYGETFQVLSNVPNPFDEKTWIRFIVPEEDEVLLTVYDIDGKVLLKRVIAAHKGYNRVELTRKELTRRGVLYYRLQYRDQFATNKMVVLGH